MFTIIKNLAEINSSGGIDIDDYVDFPNDYKNIIFIKLNNQNNYYSYEGIDLEEVSEDKKGKYLFKRASANTQGKGLNTPTIKYSEFKNFEKKTFAWFQLKQENELFYKIFLALENNKEQIKNDLEEYTKVFLSLKIDGKYIGDIPDFKAFFISDEKIKEKISFKYEVKKAPCRLQNSYCAVCFEEKEEVFGFAIPDKYKFFTVDNKGFAYNFEQESAVKQFPVCLDCHKKLDGVGKNFFTDNLNFRLCSLQYFIIPELIKPDKNLLKDFIEEIASRKNNLLKREGLSENELSEEIISDYLAEIDNSIALNFVFYEQPPGSQAFKLLAEIQEVLPSNLNKLYKSIKKVEEIFYEKKIEKFKDNSLRFNFYILKNLLVDNSERDFLEILNKMFNLQNINYQFLLKKIAQRMNECNGEYFSGKKSFLNLKINVLENFLLLNILLDLGLIITGKKIQGKINMTDKSPRLTEFCEVAPNYFDKNDRNYELKKAILGYGIFVEQIANAQKDYYGYEDSKPKPVYKKFRNFKVDLRFLKRQLPELLSYIQKYKGKIKYQDKETKEFKEKSFWKLEKLFEEICHTIENSLDSDLSAGETSYLFTLGIGLSWDYIKTNFKVDNKETANV